MAQSIKLPTLGFGSGHDLRVGKFETHIGLCIDSAEPAWNSLSSSLCPSPTHMHMHSLKINKLKKIKSLSNVFNKGHLSKFTVQRWINSL